MTAWVLAFGTAPAWQTRARKLRGFLVHRSAEPSRGAGRRLQAMAAAQIAFAVVVLVSAGLLTRSLWQLQSIDRGLEFDGVVTARILLPWQRYRTPDQFRAFHDRAVEAVDRLPGVIEMAIRSALGASPHALRRLVAGRGLRTAAAGVVTGLVATALGARALGSVLFGVEPLDPVTLATVSGGLVLLAGLACWIPARRAASTDPSETLRSGEQS